MDDLDFAEAEMLRYFAEIVYLYEQSDDDETLVGIIDVFMAFPPVWKDPNG